VLISYNWLMLFDILPGIANKYFVVIFVFLCCEVTPGGVIRCECVRVFVCSGFNISVVIQFCV